MGKLSKDQRFALRLAKMQAREADKQRAAHLAALGVQQGGNALMSLFQAMGGSQTTGLIVGGGVLAVLNNRYHARLMARAVKWIAEPPARRAGQTDDQYASAVEQQRASREKQINGTADWKAIERILPPAPPPLLMLEDAQAAALGITTAGAQLINVLKPLGAGSSVASSHAVNYDVPDVEVRTPIGAGPIAASAYPFLYPPASPPRDAAPRGSAPLPDGAPSPVPVPPVGIPVPVGQPVPVQVEPNAEPIGNLNGPISIGIGVGAAAAAEAARRLREREPPEKPGGGGPIITTPLPRGQPDPEQPYIPVRERSPPVPSSPPRPVLPPPISNNPAGPIGHGIPNLGAPPIGGGISLAAPLAAGARAIAEPIAEGAARLAGAVGRAIAGGV